MVTIALLALLTGLGGAATNQEAPDDGRISFTLRPRAVGTSWTVDRRIDSDMSMTLTVEGADEKWDLEETVDEVCRLTVTTADDDGLVVRYGRRARHIDVPMFGPKDMVSPVSGKTYHVARREGRLVVTDAAGKAVPEVEARTVAKDIPPAIAENALARLLTRRPLEPHEALRLEDDARAALFGDLSEDHMGLEVTDVTLIYCRRGTVGDTPVGIFHVHGSLAGKQRIDDADVVRSGRVFGEVRVAIRNAVVLSVSCRGTMKFTYDSIPAEDDPKGHVTGSGTLRLGRTLKP